MANAISGLDHAVLAVADPAAALLALSRLGFLVTAAGDDSAVPQLRLAEGGLALVAAPAISAVALRSASAERSHLLLGRAGVVTAPHADGLVVDLPEGTLPGLPAFLTQAPVAEAPGAHPNTARALHSLTVVVADPTAAMPAYDRVFGPFASTPTDEMVTVHTGRGLIFLVTPDGFDHLHPHLDLSAPFRAGPVALSIIVDDVEQAARVLRQGGVGFNRTAQGVSVDPADSFGVGLELVAG